MNEPYKKTIARKVLLKVLPQVASYVYFGQTEHNIDDSASGDLYTRLRREFHVHLNSSDIIQRKNVDKVYSHNGKILHVGFLEQNYAPAEERRMIGYMNDIITELTNDENNNFYSNLKDEVEFNTIIKSINNFEI